MLSADNQQETSIKPFYYTGFCVGELSCSLLRLKNRKSRKGSVYYTPDITVSNADYSLLREVNSVVSGDCGVITKIKGGFNLSWRGKEKVKKILSFFDSFPPIAGDLANSKILVIKKSISVLENQKGYRRRLNTQMRLERFRTFLKKIKKENKPLKHFPCRISDTQSIGYFLSGIMDAEGSVGMKKSGKRKQPFVAVAMKDRNIVFLFKKFLGMGNIHLRRQENMFHWELGSKKDVLKFINLFSKIYPIKLSKLKLRMIKVRRILNDYTPKPNKINIGI